MPSETLWSAAVLAMGARTRTVMEVSVAAPLVKLTEVEYTTTPPAPAVCVTGAPLKSTNQLAATVVGLGVKVTENVKSSVGGGETAAYCTVKP